MFPEMKRIVKGESMHPFLKALDVCISREVEPSRIKAGDIVIYKSAGTGDLAIHRVLNVERDGNYALIKGDNVPYKFCEKVPVSAIEEKAVAVERGKKVLNLESFLNRHAGRLLALMSRRDLTPSLFKRRFIDPFLLAISRNSLFIFFRKLSYKNISFMSSGAGKKCRLYMFVGKRKGAEAVLEYEQNKGIIVNSYIRHRNRNSFFARKFAQKVKEIATERFGCGHTIFATDQTLNKLINDDTNRPISSP
jgi:hypothetical protein